MWPQNEPMHSTIIASFPSSPGAQICIAGVRVYFLHKHELNQNRTKTERQLRTLMAWEQVKPLASFPGFSTIQSCSLTVNIDISRVIKTSPPPSVFAYCN